MFFKRPAPHDTLSICFFAAKQNINWNVQDWNKDIGGEDNTI